MQKPGAFSMTYMVILFFPQKLCIRLCIACLPVVKQSQKYFLRTRNLKDWAYDEDTDTKKAILCLTMPHYASC